MTVSVAPSAITSVTLTPSSATLAVSATSQLVPTVVQPSGAPLASVTYASSARGIATVNASGVVTAVSVGSAIIVVTATAGGPANFSGASVPRNVPITVTSAPAGITSLTASPTSMMPLETLASCIPGLNVAADLADLPSKLADFYQSLVVANARALRRQRKLSVTARHALERYEQALAEEQRAYGALAKVLDKDPPY